MKNEKPCDIPGADYSPREFENYEEFCAWVYEDQQRLKHIFVDGFILKSEPEITYHKVMDCLHSHEE